MNFANGARSMVPKLTDMLVKMRLLKIVWTAAVLTTITLTAPTASGQGNEGQSSEPPARIAILVGNNSGLPVRPALRYAEADALRMKEVLLRNGGFRAGDIHVLCGQDSGELEGLFAEAASRLGKSSGESMLFFYFSGHSDGMSVEMGRDRVPFSQIRELMAETGASLRIAVVDTCMSGQLIGAKGVSRVPGFDIEVDSELNATGTVLLSLIHI